MVIFQIAKNSNASSLQPLPAPPSPGWTILLGLGPETPVFVFAPIQSRPFGFPKHPKPPEAPWNQSPAFSKDPSAGESAGGPATGCAVGVPSGENRPEAREAWPMAGSAAGRCESSPYPSLVAGCSQGFGLGFGPRILVGLVGKPPPGSPLLQRHGPGRASNQVSSGSILQPPVVVERTKVWPGYIPTPRVYVLQVFRSKSAGGGGGPTPKRKPQINKGKTRVSEEETSLQMMAWFHANLGS